jgi:hypothetical protein
MGGPSASAKANESAQAAFYTQMTSEQTQMFASQTALLSQIQAVSAPILAAGPNQYGFSAAEDAALQDTIINQGAKATADTVNATKLQQTQATGGTNLLPTGAGEELTANAEILGAQSTATNLANEKLAGYQQGNQNYGQALSALSGVAGLESPTSYATAATGAGNASTGATELADSERSTLLSSLLGGVIGGLGSASSPLNTSGNAVLNGIGGVL